MKANALTALNARRLDQLEAVLQKAAKLGPPEDAEWSEIARSGAAAASRGELERVRTACKRCHDAYRASYRRDHRPDPLK